MKMRTLLTLAALAGPVAACTVQTTGTVVVATGQVTLAWAINGGVAPSLCNQSLAVTMSVLVYDGGGNFVGEYQAACAAFATTIVLPSGGYTATATLLDSSGNARTTSVNINPFTIISGTNVNVPINFPANSFL